LWLRMSLVVYMELFRLINRYLACISGCGSG
jgi:hypothetical protein